MPKKKKKKKTKKDAARAEARGKQALLKTGALQNAILTSRNFSIIATDEKGLISCSNPGSERMSRVCCR